MQIREKNMPFYEERIRESELQIKVFDCTQRAVIGWKGKEKQYKERIAKIRFYQQLGLSIADITSIIDAPNQVVRNVLEQQVQKLVKEQMKMNDLIKEANQIIDRLKNEDDKQEEKVYEKQKENSNNYSNHWYKKFDWINCSDEELQDARSNVTRLLDLAKKVEKEFKKI